MEAPFVQLPEDERFAATSMAHYFLSTAIMVSVGFLVLYASTREPISAALIAPLPLAWLGIRAGRRGQLSRARTYGVALLVIGAGSIPLLLPASGAELFLASNLPALYLWFPAKAARMRRWALWGVGLQFLAFSAATRLYEWHFFTSTAEEVAWWVVHVSLPIDLVATMRTLLTHRDQQQRSLEKARDMAVDVARVKTRIMNSVAHELRTPLAAALGLLGDLEETQKDDRISESTRAVERVLERTTDLLDLARLEGEGAPRLSSRSVADPAILLRKLVRDEPVELRLGRGVEGVHRFDPTLVRRIVRHLVDNALRHGQGPVVLRAEQVAEELWFEVEDAGSGIPEHLRETVFHPFDVRSDGVDDAARGPGVGLPVSRHLARSAGGELEILEREEGCAVRLRIPAVSMDGRPIPEPTTPLGLKVLVVEDEALNRKIVRRFLERLGCEVDEVVDGLFAVERVRQHQYDLVLMDVRMPRMDGLTATRVIKQAVNAPPVVALTANALAGDRERCLDAGMDGFLSKPFQSAAFLTAVGELAQTGSVDLEMA